MGNEYYGVASTPMDSYLAHYGVRGMKWGVRKAIEKGDTKKLQKEYTKAEKKLAKLTAKADVEVQRNKSKKLNKIAKISGSIGAAGAASLGGLHLAKDVNGVLSKLYSSKAAEYQKKYHDEIFNRTGSSLAATNFKNVSDSYDRAADKAWKRYSNAYDSLDTDLKYMKYSNYKPLIGLGLRAAAAGGLGTAAIAKGKAVAAKYRTTAKGHAKAVAKRDAWKREMNKAFKGTQYDASRGSITKRRKKNG